MKENLWVATAKEKIVADPLDKNTTADLIVVGGGYTGCSAALHAARRGATVRLLEAKTIGHGASGRNVGLVNSGQWLDPNSISKKMGKAAGRNYNLALSRTSDLVFSIIEKCGIECDPVRNGTLHCAHSQNGLSKLKSRAEQYQALGAEVTLIDNDEVEKRTGTAAFHGALFDPRAGTIQPLDYCVGLARSAQSVGALIHEHSPATKIAKDDNDWIVDTANGRVRAKSLILSTDGYHQDASGVYAPKYTPMHYFQLATSPLGKAQLEKILPGREGCWDTALIMSSFRLDADNRLLIGGCGGFHHFGAAIHRDWARRKLASLFPELSDQEIEYSWFGRIAMTSTHLPKILRIDESAYCIFGYSGRGIGPGTYFGSCIADVVSGDSEDCLPMAPVDNHSELFASVKHIFFESGATLYHFLSDRT